MMQDYARSLSVQLKTYIIMAKTAIIIIGDRIIAHSFDSKLIRLSEDAVIIFRRSLRESLKINSPRRKRTRQLTTIVGKSIPMPIKNKSIVTFGST